MNHGPETLGDNTDGILAFLNASHRSPRKVVNVLERMNDAFSCSQSGEDPDVLTFHYPVRLF